MATPETDPGYDPHAWHGDTVYGMRFHTPDLIAPHENADDWTSAFILDIDHIVARVRADDAMRFRVAPADLIFRDARDLEMAVDWGDSDGQIGVHEPAIDRIERSAVAGGAGRAVSFRWRIVLTRPAGGEIAFRACGFELNLRCPAVLRDAQRLPVSARG